MRSVLRKWLSLYSRVSCVMANEEKASATKGVSMALLILLSLSMSEKKTLEPVRNCEVWADCGSVEGGISSRSISSSKAAGCSCGEHEVALVRGFLPIKIWRPKS